MSVPRYCQTCRSYREDHEHPPSLFDDGYPLYGGAPPHEPVATSREAAVRIETEVGRLQGQVLDALRVRGAEGATDDELEVLLGLRHQTVSARRRELVLLGRVRPTGSRPTRSGRRAKVWVLA